MRLIAISGALALLCLFAGGWQICAHHEAEARAVAAAEALTGQPDALPADPAPATDLFRPVRIAGTLMGDALLLPVDHPQMGAGLRVIQPIETGGRRILLDRGFLYQAWANDPLVATQVEVNGNLDWPADLDDLARQAQTLPLLVVAATPTGDGVVPVPVDPARMKGRHMRNALAWFAVAAVLAGMTLLQHWRIKRRGEGNVTQ
ncbi:SURF1 family cytochrome oxidase biogenesis protein [Falsirhodobacter deserti]|uniref:SURF1 family cytochrome oxidase biogenesis protein n=1 Tax=Falsirhodobacter deserti TaxID=1365611 RepID=UPI0013E39DAC|nr:SURF1 family cytochrome oxidase biogenesis protein [Falsirhodobacter deserti]